MAEFPKPLVRVREIATGSTYETDIRIVVSAEAEAAATAEGYSFVAPIPAPEPEKYPAWRYHPEQGSRIVQSEAEATALGEGWVDSPAGFPPVPPPTPAP